jgi:transcriptional regulator with XRE-family HTH domain
MIAIRKYREQFSMTQAELADRCGVVKSAVCMWESGDRKPDIVMLKKLTEIFGCTADDLLASVETEPEAEND